MKTNLNVDTQGLREKILDLAMRGKLVEQDPNDEPASELLKQIQSEKKQLVKEGKIKKGKKLPEITDDEKPFNIPDGWNLVRLGDIINIISGRDLPKTMHLNKRNSNAVPYITGASNIENGKIITNVWTDKPVTIARKCDILLTVKGTVGKIAVLDIDMAHIARQIMALSPISNMTDQNYIILFLKWYVSVLQQKATGMIPGVTREDVSTSLIPLPPLAEQRRIADRVSELFSQVDVIEKNVAEYQDLEQAMRSKLLNLAMRGKLVEQDPSDEPASELVKQIQAERAELVKVGKIKKSKKLPEITDDEKPFDIPDSWEWVRLGDVVFNYDGMRIPLSISDRKNREKIYDYYGASGVIDKVDTYLFDRTLLLISEDGANLIARNKPIAFLATGKYWVNNHAHVVDGVDISLLTFISLVINGMNISDYISGTAQPKLTQANLNRLPIPLPPLAEQKRIADKLTRLFEDLDTIKQNLATVS